MYTKENTMISSKEEISNYVEGLDIFNSQFLYMLSNPTLERKVYEITVYAYRPDLIAEEFYGSTKYAGLVMIQAGVGLSGLKRGNKILLLSKNTVQRILSSI